VRILFLDIDGVLNRGGFSPDAQSSSLDPAAVARLNRVLADTGARLVLSSSWRYLILDGSFTVGGFDYLLRTHGVTQGALLGHTCADEQTVGRAAQIRRWMQDHGPVLEWAAVDDHPLQLGDEDWRQVRTDSTLGLTDADADALAAILSGQGRRARGG
jgi:hypothetical protein